MYTEDLPLVSSLLQSDITIVFCSARVSALISATLLFSAMVSCLYNPSSSSTLAKRRVESKHTREVRDWNIYQVLVVGMSSEVC